VSGRTMKRIGMAGVMAACVFGAGWRASGQTPTTQPLGGPVAVVNGHEVDAKKFNDILIRAAGYKVFLAVLDWDLVEQACDQAGIHTDTPDFQKNLQAEYDRVLTQVGAGDVPKEERGKVLQAIMQRQGLSEVEFQLSMLKLAGLRALSHGHIDVTDQEVKNQFDADYGEKVQVRIIQVKSLTEAAQLREAIEKDKKDPTDAAHDLGLPIQPLTISKNADAIKDIRDIAFQLQEHELSASIPMPKNNVDFLVYLDKKIPAQTDAKFDVEKEKVRKEVEDYKENQWMSQQLAFLRSNARVELLDPILREQQTQIQAALKAQQAAASQPATAPAK